MLKFISYDGKWPNLCRGILIVEKDGKRYGLNSVLVSGGCCGFNRDYSESYIERGPWEIYKENLPQELQDDYHELLELVNDNIDYGCCGGCL